MPQAYSIQGESFDWDFISDRQRQELSSFHTRERSLSLPGKPPDLSIPQHDSDSLYNNNDHDFKAPASKYDSSDPLVRMRFNLERSAFLLKRMKGLNGKPEVIDVLPPVQRQARQTKRGRYAAAAVVAAAAAPPTLGPSLSLERSDSSKSGQLSLDVSNYDYVGPRCEHGSDFHQLMNHGRLYNPSRENLQRDVGLGVGVVGKHAVVHGKDYGLLRERGYRLHHSLPRPTFDRHGDVIPHHPTPNLLPPPPPSRQESRNGAQRNPPALGGHARLASPKLSSRKSEPVPSAQSRRVRFDIAR